MGCGGGGTLCDEATLSCTWAKDGVPAFVAERLLDKPESEGSPGDSMPLSQHVITEEALGR